MLWASYQSRSVIIVFEFWLSDSQNYSSNRCQVEGRPCFYFPLCLSYYLGVALCTMEHVAITCGKLEFHVIDTFISVLENLMLPKSWYWPPVKALYIVWKISLSHKLILCCWSPSNLARWWIYQNKSYCQCNVVQRNREKHPLPPMSPHILCTCTTPKLCT